MACPGRLWVSCLIRHLAFLSFCLVLLPDAVPPGFPTMHPPLWLPWDLQAASLGPGPVCQEWGGLRRRMPCCWLWGLRTRTHKTGGDIRAGAVSRRQPRGPRTTRTPQPLLCLDPPPKPAVPSLRCAANPRHQLLLIAEVSPRHMCFKRN